MGIVLLQIIGQCGPLLGTNVFNKSDEPRYTSESHPETLSQKPRKSLLTPKII